MPGYYPIFLNLHGKCCLVVGGGEVATRKCRGSSKLAQRWPW